jgi:cysteine synthase A
MKANNILETIGNTSHVRINNLFGIQAEVWIKLERQNPAGSIKDRIALAMIEDAENKGLLDKESIIIEPTSGNTGIGLAMVAAVKKYRIIIVMPESMSIERRKLMTVYGAEVVLTPKEFGMKGAIEKAYELADNYKKAWIPMQFENFANPQIHAKTTALEIINDFPEGFDYLITGVGTGGHISGVGEVLKQKFPKIQIFAVEPVLSPVLSGGTAGAHALQGIGAGFIPKILNRSIFSNVLKVSKNDAYRYAAELAKQEGIFCGISTGASLAAIAEILPKLQPNSKILTFAYDTGERYLSIDDLF